MLRASGLGGARQIECEYNENWYARTDARTEDGAVDRRGLFQASRFR